MICPKGLEGPRRDKATQRNLSDDLCVYVRTVGEEHLPVAENSQRPQEWAPYALCNEGVICNNVKHPYY